MVREIIPEHSRRADAFALWNRAPMPMVTLMKTLDVTHLVRFSRRHRYKINMLLCWCVGRAAARMEDFYLLPVGDKLMEYDCLAVNTVVMTQNGDIQTCDLPLSSNLEQIPQALVSGPSAHLLPVPSRPAGRHSGRTIFGISSAGDPLPGHMILHSIKSTSHPASLSGIRKIYLLFMSGYDIVYY